MGTSALRITSPFCSNRLSPKSAKKPENWDVSVVSVKYILNTRRKKVFFLSHRKVCKRLTRLTHFQSTPHKGRPVFDVGFLSDFQSGIFNPHPHKGATSGAYLVNSRTAVVNPTAKACFCQSSHSCNRASSVSGASVSNCLCRASGSNKSGSRLHSPSYRASISGFSFPPLDFSRLVCYHRFRSVSALCWVVSAAVW